MDVPEGTRYMATANPNGAPTESIATVVNPEMDSLTIELEFYDETMEGVDGVTMPAPPEDA